MTGMPPIIRGAGRPGSLRWPPCPARKLIWALLALLLMLGPLPAFGQAAQETETPGSAAAGGTESPAPPGREEPEEELDLTWGFQFGAGFHYFTLESDALGIEFGEGNPFSDGASVALDWVLGSFRLGYLRQVYRREVTTAVSFRGQLVERLGIEADQLWFFHGLRPWRPLYLGYGVGVQQRVISLTHLDGTRAEHSETLAMAGLMLDIAFAPPVSLQIRSIREQGGKFVRITGETVFLSYFVPF